MYSSAIAGNQVQAQKALSDTVLLHRNLFYFIGTCFYGMFKIAGY